MRASESLQEHSHASADALAEGFSVPDDATTQASDPKSSLRSQHWHPLAPELEQLMRVVPMESFNLERTTVLTWLYLNEGAMTFDQIASMVGPNANKTLQKRIARRALRGLQRIGAVSITQMSSPVTADAAGEVEDEADPDLEEEGAVSIDLRSAALITRRGMTWMQRAWQARRLSIASTQRATIHEVHEMYLNEEEDGKGTEPHWIESLGHGDQVVRTKTTGEMTAWIGGAVASVFDLPFAMKKSRRGH